MRAVVCGVAPTSIPQSVNLQTFSGGPFEDFRILREQLERSIELAQVPAVGRVRNREFQNKVSVFNFIFKLLHAKRNTPTNALASVEFPYLSKNSKNIMELYKLKF